jgi:hypothetical protein
MTAMGSWSDLERQAPALAAAGRRLLKVDAMPIAFAATVARGGAPRLAPVCPIFADGQVYLSVGAHTPKADDLARDGRFALHAFLGSADEEFPLSGRASEVVEPGRREAVHRTIKFGAYRGADPIFLLAFERGFHARWENVGRPDTRAIRTAWSASSGKVRETRWSLLDGLER